MGQRDTAKVKLRREQDRKIFQLWHMNLTQMEIATMVGVSQATVSRAIDRTLNEYLTLDVQKWHAQQASMFADLHANALAAIKRGDLSAIDKLDKLDQAMARHIPGGVLPTKHEVSVSVDDETAAALSILAKIREREKATELPAGTDPNVIEAEVIEDDES